MTATTTMGSIGTEDSLADRKYILWDAEGVEKIPEGEEEDIKIVAEQIDGIQKALYNMHRHCYTGTHGRTHGLVKGKLIVPENLPRHLKQSMFAHGGEYPVACRYSSEPPDCGLDDRIAQPRGFAMKVFNVTGEMFEAGADFPTQDFEFNSTPALDLASARVAKEIVDLRMKYMTDPVSMYKEFDRRDDTELQKARDQVKNIHLAATRQYSQTAYRFGDYVAKFSLIPSSSTQKQMDETVSQDHQSDILHRWLQDFHRDNDAEYLLQFQLCENLDDQPVEYAGKVWDEDKYPFQTVAKLVIPKQESFDYKRKAFWEDRMVMNPWHGRKDLQPLGGSNRLRAVVYPASSKLRREMNGTVAINVRSIDEIP